MPAVDASQGLTLTLTLTLALTLTRVPASDASQ